MDLSDEIKLLNLTIISMVAKQSTLDKMKDNLFHVDVYEQYVNNLIQIILSLLDLEEKEDEYYRLINECLEDQIDDPDDILRQLLSNKGI